MNRKTLADLTEEEKVDRILALESRIQELEATQLYAQNTANSAMERLSSISHRPESSETQAISIAIDPPPLQFRDFVSQSDAGLMLVDENASVVAWSQGIEMITGLPEKQVLGRVFWDVMILLNPSLESARDRLMSEILQYHRTGRMPGGSLSSENIINHPSKGNRIVESVVIPLPVGDRFMALSVSRDVTERKHTLERLRQTEATFRAVFDSSWQAYTLIDTERRVIDVNINGNVGMRAIFGKKAQPGDSIYDYVLDQDLDGFNRNYEKALAGETVVVEKEFPTQDELSLYYEVRYFPMRDTNKETIGVCMSAENITGRRLAEKALRTSEERFRATFESAAVGIALSHREDSTLFSVNQRFQDMLGYTADELKQMTFEDITHPQDIAFENQLIEELVSRKRDKYTVEKRYIRKDRDEIWVRASISLIYDDEGEIRYGLAVVEDITERRIAEQQRIEFALEREKVHLITEFIHGVSHEFRTPLSAINMKVYLMSVVDQAERRAELHKDVEGQITSITTLVDALVTLSRLDSGVVLTTKDFDLVVLVYDIYTTLQNQFQAKRLKHTFNAAMNKYAYHGAEDELVIAITKILENAIRYTSEGDAVNIRLSTTSNHVVIEVDDTGKGMSEADCQRIFQRFYRSDSSNVLRGFGLGLPIADKIVQYHRGHIDVSSTPGAGSTFRIHLPLHDQRLD